MELLLNMSDEGVARVAVTRVCAYLGTGTHHTLTRPSSILGVELGPRTRCYHASVRIWA